MRVAMIGQKGLPATFGGIEKHCEELGSRLVALGCDVTVFCRPYYSSKRIAAEKLEKTGATRYLYKGMVLEVIPSIPTKHLDAASHSLLCSLIWAFRDYDILHYHALGPTLFSIIPAFFGKKIVSTIHGLDWQRAKWGNLAKKVLRQGEKVAAHKPDELIVVSRTLQGYFKRRHNKTAHYIPNGITRPNRRFPREISAQWRLQKDSYILFVGRLVPEKGAHCLIEAFRKTTTDKSLVIVGGDSYSKDYELRLHRMAEGDERIIFTGYVYGSLLDELYSNAYFYVHPSDIEGLPLSLLEALSYGKCVLASDIPENMEVVAPQGQQEYGFTFRRNDVESLRLRMQQLLDHPVLVEEKSSLAEEYVLETYNWDRVAEETMSVYRAILEPKQSA